MASMAGVLGSSPAVLEGSLQLGGATRLGAPAAAGRVSVHRSGFVVKASAGSADQAETSRRAVLSLVAAGLATGSFVQAVLAEAKPIPIGPPPPLSGGLPGTDNSDEARDLQLAYKNRFYLQPLGPAEAAARAKESAKEILDLKSLIDKKAWPYVQNDLRSKATYLRFDLKTVISAKPKGEKQSLKELTDKLFQEINKLDYAAKTKSAPEAEKYYASTVSMLNDVLAKLA